ncbi:hypothetical protein C8J57DRAFT_1392392 [Mycena rebaudengoi]|nr:hypothetical protein C8J57DRAFT_1392392 [Mycena rebaudengoi]
MSVPMNSEEQFKLLLKTIGDLFVANNNLVATLAWLVYDIIITLDQEIERMWGAPLTLPSFIYFTTRYYGLFFLVCVLCFWCFLISQTNYNLSAKRVIPRNSCDSWGPFESASVQLLSMSANALLAIRIDAFYNRNRKGSMFLGISTQVALSSLVLVGSGQAQVHPPGVPIPGCLSASPPRFGIAAWLANIVYQLLCLTLALSKFFAAFRGTVSKSRLADMFIRDAANMLNIILAYGTPPSALLNLCVSWIVGAFAVGAPRIILNLKGAAGSSDYTSEFEMHVRSHDESLAFRPTVDNLELHITRD